MSQYQYKIFSHTEYYKYINTFNLDSNNLSVSDLRRKWYCFDNKLGGAFAVALSNDRVVSTCYLSGKSLLLNGNLYKAYEIGETATVNDHQRKGLFSKLVKLCVSYAFDDGAELIYGTPNSQSTPGYQKLGFKIITDTRSNLFISPIISSLIWRSMSATKIKQDRLESKIIK